ncbi:MAG: hypothetical protein WAN10_13250 [Candidatus Acidiferrales bacterium]
MESNERVSEEEFFLSEGVPTYESRNVNSSAELGAYESWESEGQALAEKHHNVQWQLGDWMLVGEADFDFSPRGLGIPSYLAIGTKQESIYKVAARLTGFASQTLWNLAHIAKVFPVEKRVAGLTHSHHAIAAPFEKRDEYLAHALAEKLSCDALRRWTEEQEQDYLRPRHLKSVSLKVPPDIYRKFRDLAKFYNRDISSLVLEAALPAIETYLAEAAREVGLSMHGEAHDGWWPFDGKFKAPKIPKRGRTRAEITRDNRNERLALEQSIRDTLQKMQCASTAEIAATCKVPHGTVDSTLSEWRKKKGCHSHRGNWAIEQRSSGRAVPLERVCNTFGKQISHCLALKEATAGMDAAAFVLFAAKYFEKKAVTKRDCRIAVMNPDFITRFGVMYAADLISEVELAKEAEAVPA